MRTWDRVRLTSRCNRCGGRLEEGAPVLVLALPTVTRKFYYCAACEGPAPPDLPALVEPSGRTPKFTPVARVANSVTTRFGDRWQPFKESE